MGIGKPESQAGFLWTELDSGLELFERFGGVLKLEQGGAEVVADGRAILPKGQQALIDGNGRAVRSLFLEVQALLLQCLDFCGGVAVIAYAVLHDWLFSAVQEMLRQYEREL